MKKGRILVNRSLPRTARLFRLSSLGEAEPVGEDFLFLSVADLLDPAFSSASWTAPLRTELRRGRVRLLPLSPVLPFWEEELFLRELFAAERMAKQYATHVTAPFLADKLTESLCEMLSHFGHEEAFCFTMQEKQSAEPVFCLTPDGACIRITPLPILADACGEIVFSVPQKRNGMQKSKAAKTGTPDGAVSGVIPHTYREAALCAAKRRLSDLLFRRFEPLCAALSVLGRPVRRCTALTDAVLSAITYPNAYALGAAEEELFLAAEAAMRRSERDAFSVGQTVSLGERVPLGVLTLFNPLGHESERTVTTKIVLPSHREAHRAILPFSPPVLTLLREDDTVIPADILKSSVTAEGNVCYTVCFRSGRLLPLSFSRYLVVSEHTGALKTKKEEPTVLENKHYRIAFSDGELVLTVKATGRALKNPFFLEEQGSKREGAFFATAEGSLLAYPEPSCRILGTHCRSMELSFLMEVPVSYDFEKDERSLAVESLRASLTLSFAGDDGALLSVAYTLSDPAAYHRLRLAVRSGHMVERLLFANGRSFSHTVSGLLPAAELYAHTDGEAHFAAYLHGQTGAEWVNDTLYLTLLETDGAVGGSQHGEFFLSLGRSASHAVLRARADYVAADPFICFSPMEEMPENGTPCVPNPLEGLAYDGEGVVLSAIKPAEDGDGVILRFANLAAEESYLILHAEMTMRLTTLKEVGELPLDDTDVRLRLAPKQSLTLRFKKNESVSATENTPLPKNIEKS